MKKIFLFSLFLGLFFNIQQVFSQDIIIKRDKKQITAKVLEIGLDEIKYKNYDNLEGPIMVIRKEEVYKIKYENGTEEVIIQDEYRVNQETTILNKTDAIKFHLFSPLSGHLAFAYERMIRVGFNMETKIGIIGPGLGVLSERASGAFAKAGAKFLLSPEITINGMRYAHPLKGRYIKTELAFSAFKRKDLLFYNNGLSDKTDVNCTSIAFNLIYGKQYTLGNILTLEYYYGIGYGWSQSTPTNPNANISDFIFYNPNYYSHYYFSKSFPLTFTAGMTLGYIF